MSPARDPARYMRERRAASPRLRLLEYLSTKYGLKIADYDALLRSQDGVCAVCRQPPKPGRRLHVDHDHATGAVRALLCSPCNAALGLMDENPLFLHDLANYAEWCVQRRERTDSEDPLRHVLASMFERHPEAPYIVNEQREALQRLYTKPVPGVKRVRRGAKALDVLRTTSTASPETAFMVAPVRVGDQRDAVFV